MVAKAYFTYNGIKCYGYDVHFTHEPDFGIDKVFIGATEYSKLCDADISDFAPKVDVKPGSSLYVVPPCDVALDDIRREYKIKRNFDGADFNVFSSIDSHWSQTWTCVDGMIIDHANKAVYISVYSSYDVAQYAIGKGIDILNCTKVHESMLFRTPPPFEPGGLWTELILGTTKKPCISINDLKFEARNELDIDALMLVYRLDKQNRYIDDSEVEKFNLQLKSLNQTNWMEYPLTMNMLFNELLFYKSNGTYRYCKGRISTIPKAIKHFYSQVKKPDTYTKKDLDMAKAFLMNLLDMKEVMYVSSSALAAKLQKINMLPEYFEQYFDCVVRIKSKDYVEN